VGHLVAGLPGLAATADASPGFSGLTAARGNLAKGRRPTRVATLPNRSGPVRSGSEMMAVPIMVAS
jgi:hypothetical protein